MTQLYSQDDVWKVLESEPTVDKALAGEAFGAILKEVEAANDAKLALAEVAFTSPEADWNVMLDSLRARLKDRRKRRRPSWWPL